MAKEKCIHVEIGYQEQLDVLPNLRHIHLCDKHGEEYACLYFNHISQITNLINALQEMKESFINELK